MSSSADGGATVGAATAGGLDVELVDPRRTVAPAGWDAYVTSGQLATIWRWPVVAAWAAAGSGERIAAIVRDGRTPVALATFCRRPPGIVEVRSPASSAMPGITWPVDPGAELGTEPVDRAVVSQVLHAFETAVHLRWRTAVAVWYRQVYATVLPAMLHGPAVSHPGWPIAYFHNSFDSYDAYLATLPKSRRVDQRRLVRRIDEDPDVEVTWGPGLPPADDAAMHALIDRTSLRYRPRRFRPPAGLPRGVVNTLVGGPDGLMISYRRTGTLIAAGLTVDHPTRPIASVWGALEPGDGGRNGLWFDQTARVLRWVIESGRRGIVGGKGLVDLKCKLGYTSVPQWSVARRLGR